MSEAIYALGCLEAEHARQFQLGVVKHHPTSAFSRLCLRVGKMNSRSLSDPLQP